MVLGLGQGRPEDLMAEELELDLNFLAAEGLAAPRQKDFGAHLLESTDGANCPRQLKEKHF
jgi:hypothetical protein